MTVIKLLYMLDNSGTIIAVIKKPLNPPPLWGSPAMKDSLFSLVAKSQVMLCHWKAACRGALINVIYIETGQIVDVYDFVNESRDKSCRDLFFIVVIRRLEPVLL